MLIPKSLAHEIEARGARATLERGGKHYRLTIFVGDRHRFVTMSGSAGDQRAQRNQLRDVRRVLRELGA